MRFRASFLAGASALLALLAGSAAHAQGAKPEVNSGDTAWMLAAAALVLLMTPGWRSSTAAWCGARTCSRR